MYFLQQTVSRFSIKCLLLAGKNPLCQIWWKFQDVFCQFSRTSFSFPHKEILILSNIYLLVLPILFLVGIKSYCGMVDKVFLVVFQGYKTIFCAVNFYSIKYISLFYVLFAFFVYNICNSFRCFLYVAVTALSRRWLYISFVNLRFCVLA